MHMPKGNRKIHSGCEKGCSTEGFRCFSAARSSQKPVQGGLKPTAAMQVIKDFDVTGSASSASSS